MELFSALATRPVSVRGRLLFSAFPLHTLIPFFRFLLSAFNLRRFLQTTPGSFRGFYLCYPISLSIDMCTRF
ncbi:hypothetical protein EDD15DRAFT_2280416, partial [Pisolithus albus]